MLQGRARRRGGRGRRALRAGARDERRAAADRAGGRGRDGGPPETAWTTAGALPQLSGGGTLLKEVAGEPILFLRLDGTAYAYRPHCPAAAPRSRPRALERRGAHVPGVRASYDARRAGRCLDAPDLHLEPVPLLDRRQPGWSGWPSGRGGLTRGPPGSRASRRAARPREASAGAATATGSSRSASSAASRSPPEHRHLVDLQSRRLLCACRACKILFDRPAAGRREPAARARPPPRAWRTSCSTTRLGPRCASRSTWRSSSTPRRPSGCSRFYPSPMGATESLLELDAWTQLEADNPVLRELEPDVEALLVSRARGHARALARPDRRLLRAGRPHPHPLAGAQRRQRGVGGHRALLRRPAIQGGSMLKTGKPDVEAGRAVARRRDPAGQRARRLREHDGAPARRALAAERSTGINPEDAAPIDPSMPNLSPA